MTTRLYPHDDFEATIRIYSPDERGRKIPAHNAIRWDFSYADDPAHTLYMIWPDFCRPDGDSYSKEELLPVGVPLRARMVILNTALRAAVHASRLAPGVRFFCHEGPLRVAEGVVTQVTGLPHPPAG